MSNQRETTTARNFLSSFIIPAEKVIGQLEGTIDEKIAVTKSFVNSACEVVKQHFRLHRETSVVLIKSVFPTETDLAPALQNLEGHADDGFHRLISGWRDANSLSMPSISLDDAIHLLRSSLGIVDKPKDGTFESILSVYFDNALKNEKIYSLFVKYSEGNPTMTIEQFKLFNAVEQGVELTERQVSDKIRNRFGGTVTRFNFCSYLSSKISNNALDPQRATNIWQDMTQPLPRYMVYTLSVNSSDDFNRALEDGARALVLHVQERDGRLYSGTCDLEMLLTGIKSKGFSKSPYPIILCLAPTETLSHATQDSLAALLRTCLGDSLARGIMFDGAILNDPSFSPAALQNKVLIMGFQAPLKPFVGLFVADMHRDGLGVRVTDVRESTPASKAGIFKDDWLTHINGVEIHNKQHLKEQLRQLHLGEEFVMKKENLDEVRVVVGGAVEQGDDHASKDLSNLIFLKLCAPADRQHAPWEADSLEEDKIASSPPARTSLNDHFSFLPIAHAESFRATINAATNGGVQFVDAGQCTTGHMWARGMFRENAHCGYLLKSAIVETETATVHLEILAPPVHMHSAVLKRIEQRFAVAGASIHENEITFTDCCETDVSVLDLVFDMDNTEVSLSATFPPLLLRGGYRTLDVSLTSDERLATGEYTGVLCHITTDRQLDGTFKTVKLPNGSL